MGRDGGYGLNQNEDKSGKTTERSTWGATPKLMARGKIMKVMNEERKPEKN